MGKALTQEEQAQARYRKQFATLEKAVAAGRVVDVWWDEGYVNIEIKGARRWMTFEEAELGPILITLFRLPSGMGYR